MMANYEKNATKGRYYSVILFTGAILILFILVSLSLVGCDDSAEPPAPVEYSPLPGDDWQAAPPAEQG
ncbi:MAG: hypothetical protein PVJ34_03450, partial [Anaerolineae bacterium]